MTLPIKFANYAFSTLAVGCDTVATSIAVPAGHGARFPALAAGEYFYATLENAALNREIVKVTARVDDTLTVVRAQDNTTARSWNAGDSVSLRVNAAAFADISKAENHEYTPAGTGAVAATVQSKLRESVSVFDFMTTAQIADVQSGAATLDVTTAIQNAINAVQAFNGVLYLPRGVYCFSSTLVISKRMTLRGSGMGNPTPGNADSAGTVLKKTADCIGILINSGANFATLEDFCLFGTFPTGFSSGIQNGQTDATNGAGGTTFKKLWIQGHKGHGLNITNGNSGRIDGVYLQSNAMNGLNISSTHTTVDNTNAWVGTGVTAIGNTGNGINIDKASSNTIIGFDCEGNTGYGLYVNRPYNFINGYVENNTSGPLKIDGSAFNNVIFLRSVSGTYTINNGNNYVYTLDGSGKYPYLRPEGWMNLNSAIMGKRIDVPYNVTTLFTATDGNEFVITVNNGSAFTVANPLAPFYSIGQRITVRIVNTSGGALGTVTWGANYKMAAWTSPANGFSRAIDFQYDGTNWIEVSRTPADVPN